MDLFDAMRSLRAMRRLKPDPIPDEILQQILEAAFRAPSGGNRQPWFFLVAREAQTRAYRNLKCTFAFASRDEGVWPWKGGDIGSSRSENPESPGREYAVPRSAL
jgi:nitroreductase